MLERHCIATTAILQIIKTHGKGLATTYPGGPPLATTISACTERTHWQTYH